MANNWAIVIGINQYRFLQPLKYAKRDAEAMQKFLMQEAKFDRIFLFTDDSPEIGGKPTEPFRANLLRVLRQIFAEPFMKDGDNFWFFFSGHGIPHNGQDYLMPLDGDPEDIENTGISTNTITNYLRSCGADNAVMILDACRSSGKKSGEGIGRQTEAEARQTGVISLFSCSPNQYSYELEAVSQGAFTYALLEGLGIQGKCATVKQLNQYLKHRVPELISLHLGRAKQTPYTIAEPLERTHLILMPQHAKSADSTTLKNDAYRAQMNQSWELAQQLWIRVNALSLGQDMQALEALQNLSIQRHTKPNSLQSKPPQPTESSRTVLPPISPKGMEARSPEIIELCEKAYPNESIRVISWNLEKEQTLTTLFRECRRGWYFQQILFQNQKGVWQQNRKVCPIFIPLLEPDEYLWEKLTRSASSEDWYALDEIIRLGIQFSESEIRLVGSYSIGENVADDAMEQFGVYVPNKDLLPALIFINKRLGLFLISYLKHPEGFAKENMLCDKNTNECQVFISLQEAQQTLRTKLEVLV